MDTTLVFPRLTDGIGNRLFQLYAARKYSEDHGVPLRIVIAASSADHGTLDDMLNLFPDLLKQEEKPEFYTILSDGGYDNLYSYKPFEKLTGNVCMSGCWQAFDYAARVNLFPNWKHSLKDKTNSILEKANLSTYEEQRNTWMIHIRHGDYDILPHHSVPLKKYYMKCIYEIPKGARLHLFSDELEKCKEFVESICEERDLTFTCSKETHDVSTLYEMAYCIGGSIIGNSTFGWWGAFYAYKRALNMGLKPKAFYPAVWGVGFPDPTGIIPYWGTKVSLD